MDMPSNMVPDVNALLAHASWVRKLARTLVRDPGRADDLVQETWLAAIEAGPRAPGALRAWLRRVMANLAFEHHRRDHARARRERNAAQLERLPSVAEMTARAELERRLVDQVLALEEPYRATILYCFFEDRSAAELARSLGIPSSTVRNRLKRALEMLRVGLGTAERTQWVWCLESLASSTAATAGTGSSLTGALIMGLKAKLAVTIAGAVVITGGVILWRETTGAPSARSKASVTSDERHPPQTPGPASSGSTPVADQKSSVPRVDLSAARVASEILVHGSVRARSGERISEGTIEIVNEWGETHSAPVVEPGTYAASGVPPGSWVLRARSPGYCQATRELELLGDHEVVRADVALDPAPVIAVRFITPEGKRVERPLRTREHAPWVFGLDGVLGAIATHEMPQLLACLSELQPAGEYTASDPPPLKRRIPIPEGFAGVIELRYPPPAYVSAVLDGIVLETRPVDATTTEVAFVIAPDKLVSSFGELRVRLIDDQGAPIAQAGIALYPLDKKLSANPVMSPLENGMVVRNALPPGTHQLQIRVPGKEHQTRVIRIESGRSTDLGEIVLRGGAVIHGTVVDDRGAPVDVPVEWSPASARERPCYAPPLNPSPRPGGFFEAELPRDGVLIRVADPHWAVNPTLVDTSAERTEGVRILASRGTVLTLRVAAPERSYELRLIDSTATEVWRATVLDATTFRVRLLPGTYGLVRRDATSEQPLQDVVVGMQPVEVDLER